MIDNSLQTKRLLMLGGASYAPYLKEYANAKGFQLLAAGNQLNPVMEQYTDEFYMAEATNVEQICELVQKEKIDGIVALGNEDIINSVIDVAQKCHLSFYLNKNHWNELQNKENFKKHCREFDIDTVEEYYISSQTSEEELGKLPYPLVFKPSDSCGSKGITICYNADEIKNAIQKALTFSRSNEFIVEKFMQCPEFIVSYIIVDGKVHIWMLGDRHMNTQQKGLGALSNLSVYPSRFSDLYLNTVHKKMEKLLTAYGPKNGTMFIQGFVDNGKIRFFDPGLRFCGTLDTILYTDICGVNPLHWMVNHSLVGKMCATNDLEKMDYRLYGKVGAQLSIIVYPGCIKKIEGIEAVRAFPEVISTVQLLQEGDIVDMVGTLQQVLVRIHLVVDNKKKLLETVEKIYNTIRVTNVDGEEMKMPYIQNYDL